MGGHSIGNCFRTLVAVAALLASAAGANSIEWKTKQIVIEYERPENPAHLPIYDELKRARALEYLQEALGSIRLPRPLQLTLMGCDGTANAWYRRDTVTVCYEYVAEIYKNAPTRELPLGITRIDTIAGPLFDVFMHESGHAIFDLLEVPIMGREEDAADYFSAYVMLHYDKQRARELILGSAYQYVVEMKPEATLALKTFSDEHGLPAQRFYNVLCIAYGSDPKLFADVVEKGFLPKDRADGCEDEYHTVDFAIQKLIAGRVDKRLAREFFKKKFKVDNLK